jgi:hypothetical protein
MTSIEALGELMDRQEDLNPELAAYLEPDGPLGPALRHPLVYNIAQPPQMNAMANAQLRYKKEALRRALRTRQWNTAVYLHERPYRIDAFCNYCWRMGDSSYWKLLGSIYTDTENLWQNKDMWVDCLTAERRYRSHMMTPEERVALRQDHDPVVTVYRGWNHQGDPDGLSWTTNRIVAKYFARRFAERGGGQWVATGQVKRKDCLAFFDGRSEQEMLILPGSVYNVQVEEVFQ